MNIEAKCAEKTSNFNGLSLKLSYPWIATNKVIIMLWLKLLFFNSSKFRSFVKIDQNGVCSELIRCQQPPADTWVEVDEFCVSWLGKPLPGHACKASLAGVSLLSKRQPSP